MKKYSINETYIAKEGQTIFQAEKPFLNNTVSVFVNGMLQELGEDKNYLTVQDIGKIIFQQPLYEGDVVSIVSNVVSEKINLEIMSPGKADKPNALYRKYGTVKRLQPNNKYEINIVINKEPIVWNFVSKANPLFCTVKKIFEDIGEFIEGFTEEYVLSILSQNSHEVIELIDDLANQEDPVENVTYETDNEGMYTTTYRAVKDWVKYKSEIELVYARYYGISNRYGTVQKIIGDVTIMKKTDLPNLDDLLDRLKDLFDNADQIIRGVDIVKAMVKAIDLYKYDDWERTTNF